MLNNVFKNLHESYENFIWMIGGGKANVTDFSGKCDECANGLKLWIRTEMIFMSRGDYGEGVEPSRGTRGNSPLDWAWWIACEGTGIHC